MQFQKKRIFEWTNIEISKQKNAVWTKIEWTNISKNSKMQFGEKKNGQTF